MQEIKKTRIVIASVLKPVDDTRMFEKMGMSLQSTGNYEVHIIGYPSIRPVKSPVTFHPLSNFRRISLMRMTASWKVLAKIIPLRPSILIITTHELLFASMLARIFTSCKVVYDIRENYFRNIFYTDTFPFGIRHLIACFVRLKERICAPFIHHFTLAEKAYETELTFLPAHKTIIENKLAKPDQPVIRSDNKPAGRIDLLFSGTIARTTGVFKAIEIAKALHRVNGTVHLTIVGYCAQTETLREVYQQIQHSPFIELIGGNVLVPHTDILAAIGESDLGIIAYPFNTSTMNAIPTKLFEYLGHELPILLTNHKPWVEICKPYLAAIVFDPDKPDAHQILTALKQQTFYSTKPSDVFWENEEVKLKDLITALRG